MREILFKGQRVDNGQWVYGMPLYGNLDTTITEMQCYINNRHYIIEIKPESIGQFTGMLDKNGNKIFEGDKCKVTFYNHIEKNSELIMNVVFTDGGFALIKEGKITTESVIEDDRTFVPLYYSQRPNEIEIIGNIHENGDK